MKTDNADIVIVGIDWASKKHDVHIIHADGESAGQIVHQIDQIDAWVDELYQLANGKPIAIAIEQKRGPLLNALIKRENITIYPIDPGKFKNYRESFTKEAKTDGIDARYLAKMLSERIETLVPISEVSADATKLHETTRLRRTTVDERSRVLLKLQAELNAYFPLILELFSAANQKAPLQLLKRWPTLAKLKKAHPKTIRCALRDGAVHNQEQQDRIIQTIRGSKPFCRNAELAESHAIRIKMLVTMYELLTKSIVEYDERLQQLVANHPDAHLFLDIKGVGPVIGARLIAAFEMEAGHCVNADQLSARAGISPVPNSSGKTTGKRHVARRACNKYLKQTFHEFVDSARIWCKWTKARYQQLKAKNVKHNAAIRKIARSWIRILYRIWHTKKPFDAQRYFDKITLKNPELHDYVTPQKNT